MRILYDHQIFEHQRLGGISKYHIELMKRLKLFGSSYDLSLSYSSNQYLSEIGFKVKGGIKDYFDFLPGVGFPGKWSLYRGFERLSKSHQLNNLAESKKALEKKEFDLFHPTEILDPYFLDHLGGKPYVITVHDLILERLHEKGENQNPKFLSSRKQIIENASGIIVVSEFTKSELLHFFHLDSEKVKVIHHGVNRQTEAINAFRKNLLYVGARSSYKNFDFMLESVQDLIRDSSNLMLICIGNPFSKEEEKKIKKLKLERKVISMRVSEEELNLQYQKALAFIYPSKMEGFGMPILEAMSNGCPVLASNAGPIPEVGGDSALYFSPDDASSIKTTVDQIIEDKKLQEKLSKKGLARASKFSWERTTEETISFYQSCI